VSSSASAATGAIAGPAQASPRLPAGDVLARRLNDDKRSLPNQLTMDFHRNQRERFSRFEKEPDSGGIRWWSTSGRALRGQAVKAFVLGSLPARTPDAHLALAG